MDGTASRIVENAAGAWIVRSPASVRVSFRSASRSTAVIRAKEIVRNLGGGTVEIHGPDDALEQVTVVPPPSRRRRRPAA